MCLFFKQPEDFRKWLAKNHDRSSEQWIGFYKVNSGNTSITWPESVDVALCFGWIDGLRKSIDAKSYKIRFTPRKPDSHWSAVNIKRVPELQKLGLMEAPGLEAFKKRKGEKSAQAAYEQKQVTLDPAYEKALRKHKGAWQYWQAKAPSYRKQCIWWVMSAKREETRQKRLQTLIDSCANSQLIPPMKWATKKY